MHFDSKTPGNQGEVFICGAASEEQLFQRLFLECSKQKLDCRTAGNGFEVSWGKWDGEPRPAEKPSRVNLGSTLKKVIGLSFFI